MSMNKKNLFITTARLEGISFIALLFIAMPLKYMLGMPLYVKLIGYAHGFLFIGYVLLLLMIKEQEKMDSRKLGLGLMASVVPFGTFWFERQLSKN